MEIVYTETAQEDLQYWKKTGHKSIQKKISSLLQSIIQDPFKGTGKPEPLKYELAGYWSRRINQEHRMVYKIEENKVTIISLRYHY